MNTDRLLNSRILSVDKQMLMNDRILLSHYLVNFFYKFMIVFSDYLFILLFYNLEQVAATTVINIY